MPRVESTVVVDVSIEIAFAVSQTYGAVRLRWDPFIRHQELLDGAERAAKGVRTLTRSRHGLSMVSEYVRFRPPTTVGMRMVEGPWFFDNFAGGWSFGPGPSPGQTEVTWRYSFTTRPRWLAPIADRVGTRLLQRDIDRRINGFAAGCDDPVVQAAAGANADAWSAD